jgi:hypothetical protein
VFGNQTSFVNNSTGAISSQLWNFGNGYTSTSFTPAPHTYSSAGNYIVSLYVETAAGCWDSIKKTITIYQLPQVSFGPPNGCAGNLVPFADHSNPIVGSILNWQWNFGDPASGTSNTSTLEAPQHSYDSAGQYSVSLMVTTDKGCQNLGSGNINIKPSPNIDFSNSAACFGSNIVPDSPQPCLLAHHPVELGFGDSIQHRSAPHTFIFQFRHLSGFAYHWLHFGLSRHFGEKCNRVCHSCIFCERNLQAKSGAILMSQQRNRYLFNDTLYGGGTVYATKPGHCFPRFG